MTMQLRRRTFLGAVTIALAAGVAVGAFSATRAELGRPTVLSQAPVTPVPVLPVQMPPQGGTFASVAETAADRLHEAQDTAQEGLSEAVRRGGAAAQEAHDAWADFDDALRETVRARPYAALAVAGAIGFLYALARRR